MNTRELLSLPAAEALAEGFARTVVELAERAGGADRATLAALRQAARAASLATAAGHSCATLAELPGAAEAGLDVLRQRLLGSGMVADDAAAARLPLRLDAEDRLYLWRYHAVECRVAARLAGFAADEPGADAAALVARRLDERLGADDPARPDLQRRAVERALRQRLTVISGGPGTGKTTTVVQILALLLELDPACRIVLAAPTGKAAARLRDAVRAGGEKLPAALRALLPEQGFTIHRLLAGSDGATLAADLLVVDEASMLDLMLADRLLAAIGPRTRLILLGDRHQLAAVEAGAVFAELCGGDATPPPLPGRVVELRHSYRFGSATALGRLAAAARAGDAAALFAGFDGATTSWIADAAAQPDADSIDRLFAGYAPYIAALDTALAAADPVATAAPPLFAALAGFRVLCALRAGPRGVAAVNEVLAQRLRAQRGDFAGGVWFAGRPVLVTRNDPLLRLFNGDVGIALPAADGGFRVAFEDAATPGGIRFVAPARLPPHETALAMTVHKSQGSEFGRVALLLPAQRSAVATRELLYTGITRARQAVTVLAPADVLSSALATPTDRHSGLGARLLAAAPAVAP